jgi:hypothetical protein
MHVSTIFLNCNKGEETYMIKMSFPIRTCLGPSLPFREVYFYFGQMEEYVFQDIYEWFTSPARGQ